MTTIYKFKAGYTKLGIATAPSSVPTISIDDGTNILVTGSTTSLTPLAGEYRFSYTGTAGLDLVGIFHTSDLTIDQYDIFSHTPEVITTDLPILITNVATIPTDYARRTGDYAVTGDAMDLVNAPNNAALVAIGTAVWATTVRTLSSFGTLIADIWSYGARTLTQTLASITSSILSGNTLTILRGDSISIAITGLGNMVGISKLYFTVKNKEHDTADNVGMLQIEKTGGLLFLNGQTTTITNGSITVNDTTLGNITVAILPAASSQLPLGTHYYDIQRISSSGTVSTLALGDFTVTVDITKATT